MAKKTYITPDWLSASTKLVELDQQKRHREVRQWVRSTPHLSVPDDTPAAGRAPYNTSFKTSPRGRFFYSDKPAVRTGTLEIEGQGCQSLYEAGLFDEVVRHLQIYATRITRFDLAVDIETDTMPDEFAALRSARYETISTINSSTGQTVYVGQPSSAKRARVYRYYAPHERAHLLRVEMVFKKPDADEAVGQFLRLGPVEFAAAAGNGFGWSHPDWNLSSAEKIRSWRPERGRASTLRWLQKQVIPALASLHEDDVLDDTHPIWRQIANVTPLELRSTDE